MRSHFVSDYLTHWTGNEVEGFGNLKSILSDCRLWLTYNPHFWPDNQYSANLRMVCFTDIPHHLSSEHCLRYGKFGIVFKKSALMEYGANPVLYITNNGKNDAVKVYNFICDANTDKTRIDPDALLSLKILFGFVQEYKFKDEECYYEREWRILGDSLELCEDEVKPPGKCGYFMQKDEDGYPGKQYYIQFSKEDVEFLICPKEYNKDLAKLYDFPVQNYEYLIL